MNGKSEQNRPRILGGGYHMGDTDIVAQDLDSKKARTQ
jgi:hypothetical protein